MRLLWLIDLDPSHRMRHGATLRYGNLAKNLRSMGHEIYFCLLRRQGIDSTACEGYLRELQSEGYLTDFFFVDFQQPPRSKTRVGSLIIQPNIRNWLLTSSVQMQDAARQLSQLIARCSANVCILADRKWLPLFLSISQQIPTIIDWTDSFSLVSLRELRFMRRRKRASLVRRVHTLLMSLGEERFYSRKCSANLIVSAADKKMFDRINRRPATNYVLTNGVTSIDPSAAPESKEAKRLIFTGSMDFPPNLEGILWFLDEVFPSVCRRMKDIHLVIAGQDPSKELLARRSPQVRIVGLVADLRSEIARSHLFVAPLISGAGFRNKVVEAIDSGTYVIGTPMAFEFLPDQIRSRLLTAANPADFADGIYRFLSDPAKFDCELRLAREMVRQEYQWAKKAEELEQLCQRELDRRTKTSLKAS